MKRFMYRAQLLQDNTESLEAALPHCKESIEKLVETGVLMTASLYYWDNQLFLYYECIDQEITPDSFLGEIDFLLETWPAIHDTVKWETMIDIFHFDTPLNEKHWKRTLPVEDRAGRLAQINPELLSSYIYYHYALQEAQRDRGNKYCVIGLHENFIFLYEEFPAEFTKSSFVGKLDTSMHVENWQELMFPHFMQWPDAPDENLRKLETLLSF